MTGYRRASVASAVLISAVLISAVLFFVGGCGLFGGSTVGELVAFEQLAGFDHPTTVAELSAGQESADVFSEVRADNVDALPALTEDVRRFAFIVVGCKQDSAQLVVQDGVLDVQLLEGGSTEAQTDCGQAVYFLAVFDVPADDLPADVQLP